MGEYWKPVNLTRGEFIHPHHQDCGLKLGEWWGYDSPVSRLMQRRWKWTDDIRAISDYGGQMQLSGSGDAVWPEYELLEEQFVEIGIGEPEAVVAVDPVDGIVAP